MKHSSLIVESQERIRFAYELAESAPRAAAFLVDVFFEGLLALLVILSTLGSAAFLVTRSLTGGVAIYAAFAYVVLFAIQWGYGVFFELLFAGRTPGKRLFKLRVVRLDGSLLDARAIVVRNLLRAADGLPFMALPLLGSFVSLADPWSRRLGDLVAGTIVVKDQRATLVLPTVEAYFRFQALEPLTLPPGRRLDEAELYVLRRFLASREHLPMGRLDALAKGLADKTAARLGLEPPFNAEHFLEAVYRAHGSARTTLFAAPRKAAWEELAALLELIRRRGRRQLGEKALRFAGLYREVSGDLAEARSTGLAADVVDYLNALVGEARAQIYSMPPLGKQAFRRFFTSELPGCLARNRVFVLISAFLFLGSLSASFLVSASQGGKAASLIVSESTLEGMLRDHASNDFSGQGGGEGSLAASFYIANNVGIGFVTIASGVFLGLGPLFFLVENGLSLGAIFGYVVAKGAGEKIGRFVIAHSVFELSGLILAGACGLLLGWTILKAGRTSRAEALRLAMDDFLPLLAAAALLTFAAAFIEAFVAPSSLSVSGRFVIAGACLAFIIAYFGLLPRLRRTA